MAATIGGDRGEKRFDRIDRDLNLLQWMVGFNLAACLAILLKLLHG